MRLCMDPPRLTAPEADRGPVVRTVGHGARRDLERHGAVARRQRRVERVRRNERSGTPVARVVRRVLLEDARIAVRAELRELRAVDHRAERADALAVHLHLVRRVLVLVAAGAGPMAADDHADVPRRVGRARIRERAGDRRHRLGHPADRGQRQAVAGEQLALRVKIDRVLEADLPRTPTARPFRARIAVVGIRAARDPEPDVFGRVRERVRERRDVRVGIGMRRELALAKVAERRDESHQLDPRIGWLRHLPRRLGDEEQPADPIVVVALRDVRDARRELVADLRLLIGGQLRHEHRAVAPHQHAVGRRVVHRIAARVDPELRLLVEHAKRRLARRTLRRRVVHLVAVATTDGARDHQTEKAFTHVASATLHRHPSVLQCKCLKLFSVAPTHHPGPPRMMGRSNTSTLTDHDVLIRQLGRIDRRGEPGTLQVRGDRVRREPHVLRRPVIRFLREVDDRRSCRPASAPARGRPRSARDRAGDATRRRQGSDRRTPRQLRIIGAREHGRTLVRCSRCARSAR